MPADMTLVDVLGADVERLYAAGQTLVVLEGLRLRQPELRTLLFGGRSPRLLALSLGRLYVPPDAIPTGTDLPHTGLLRAQCLRELAVEPLDIGELSGSAKLYEIRLSSLAPLRQATWDLAAAADELLAAKQGSGSGVLSVLRLRARHRLKAAEEAWEDAQDAMLSLAAQLPLQEVLAPLSATPDYPGVT